MTADQLLDWMSSHHIPLQLFREEDGGWVVVDGSKDTVLASGADALEALTSAYTREAE